MAYLNYAKFSYCEALIECSEALNGYSRRGSPKKSKPSSTVTPMISLNHRKQGPEWLTPTADRARRMRTTLMMAALLMVAMVGALFKGRCIGSPESDVGLFVKNYLQRPSACLSLCLSVCLRVLTLVALRCYFCQNSVLATNASAIVPCLPPKLGAAERNSRRGEPTPHFHREPSQPARRKGTF